MTLATNKHFNSFVFAFLSVFALVSAFSTEISAFELEWATEIEDFAFFNPVKSTIDENGNIYIAVFRCDDRGDPYAIRVMKLNSVGEMLWTTEFDEDMYPGFKLGEFGFDNVAFDDRYNTYLTCFDFDFNNYLIKINNEGEIEWQHLISEVVGGRNKPAGVKVDNDENILVIVKNYTRQVVTLHFLWYDQAGELIRRTQHAPDVFFEPLDFTQIEDGYLLTGYIPPFAQDDPTTFRMHKYNLDGEVQWEQNLLEARDIASLPTAVCVSNNLAYVSWVQMNHHIHHIMVVDLIEHELIWEVNNLPMMAHTFSPMMVSDIDGFIYGGGTRQAYGGAVTFQLDFENEELRWENTETWNDDGDHLNGGAFYRQATPNGGCFMTGFAMRPDERGWMYAPTDMLLAHYDSDGNRVDEILQGAEGWEKSEGRLFTYDPEGSIVVTVKKLRPREGFGYDQTLEIRKYSIGEMQPPDLSFPDEELVFADNFVNERISAEIRVINDGLGSGRIERIELDEGLEDVIFVEENIPMRIQAESERTITFTWTPLEEGDFNGQMRIFHNDEELDNPVEITLRGEAGAQRYPELSIPSLEVFFDEVVIGNSAVSKIDITNDGDGFGVIDSITFEDVNIDEISVNAEFPYSLAPSSTDSIEVIWSPTEETELDGILLLYHNDENLDNPLEMVVSGEALSVSESEINSPGDISISINPNPFNSKAIIHFSLPHSSDVNLKVYDFTGRELSSLVAGRLEAGVYSSLFDASLLPAGIYLARLDVGNQRYMQKMALVK